MVRLDRISEGLSAAGLEEFLRKAVEAGSTYRDSFRRVITDNLG
jgi:hypothetical protein